MDTIRFLLGKIVALAVVLLLISFVLWLVGVMYPDFKPMNILKGELFTRDWLPAPKNYGGLLGKRTNSDENGKVYVPGPAYDGYANANGYYQSTGDVEWVIYTSTGTQIIGSRNPSSGTTTAYAQKSLYVRNLSIYNGGSISYGMTFVGEARETMFKNGIFPILVLDEKGRILATTEAINTGTWSIPGWARFQATIRNQLPKNTPCTLLFLSGNQQSVRIGMNVRCN